MSTEVLPNRAKPQALHEICRFIRGKGEVSKSDVYSSIDENQKTLRRTLQYGVTLGFLEQDGERFKLTNRGSGISYSSSFEGQEPILEGFREGIEDFGPYRDAILRIYDGDLTTTVNDSRVIEQDTFREVLEESVGEGVEGREVNVLIKTADAAGLGEYKAGRRGYQTRLVLSDSFEIFASELLEQYPLPEEPEEEAEEMVQEEIDEETNVEDQEDQEVTKKSESVNPVKLTVELDVSGKDEEEIARIVRKIQQGEI